MRTIAAAAVAAVLGAALGVLASVEISRRNDPDRAVQVRIEQIRDQRLSEPDVVEYGQR
jgi:hypothetical protein